jgi:hypothetical protein
MKKGILKKNECKGLVLLYRKLFKKSLTYWIVEIDNQKFHLLWDNKYKIDDIFNGKEIGYVISDGLAVIKTFYPEKLPEGYFN